MLENIIPIIHLLKHKDLIELLKIIGKKIKYKNLQEIQVNSSIIVINLEDFCIKVIVVGWVRSTLLRKIMVKFIRGLKLIKIKKIITNSQALDMIPNI